MQVYNYVQGSVCCLQMLAIEVNTIMDSERGPRCISAKVVLEAIRFVATVCFSVMCCMGLVGKQGL